MYWPCQIHAFSPLLPDQPHLSSFCWCFPKKNGCSSTMLIVSQNCTIELHCLISSIIIGLIYGLYWFRRLKIWNGNPFPSYLCNNGICRRKETGRNPNTDSPTAGPAPFRLQHHDCRMFFQLLVMSRRRRAKPTNHFIQCWVWKTRITSISSESEQMQERQERNQQQEKQISCFLPIQGWRG